jgi:hypothetical protein
MNGPGPASDGISAANPATNLIQVDAPFSAARTKAGPAGEFAGPDNIAARPLSLTDALVPHETALNPARRKA